MKVDGMIAGEQLQKLSALNTELIKLLGENPNREGLLKTPTRMAKSLSFLTSGYQQDPKEVISSAMFENESQQALGSPMMVCVKDIELFSMCEHHMLPFFGRVHIAYFPDQSIVGLSKLPRLVEVFARRLQVQERLTREIMDALEESLRPLGVAVAIEATHLCMMMRGVRSQSAETFTLATSGLFERVEYRSEFLNRLK